MKPIVHPLLTSVDHFPKGKVMKYKDDDTTISGMNPHDSSLDVEWVTFFI